jgi:hypothetical protein
MPIERLVKFPDLVTYLDELKAPYRIDTANQVCEVAVTVPVKTSLFIRWETRVPYVQIFLPFVNDVPANRVADVCDAVVRANAINPLPGLGYQHDLKFVYMRLCVPMYEEGMLAVSFQKQIHAVLRLAQDFVGAFQDIVKGEPGSAVMTLAVAHKHPEAGNVPQPS